MKRRLSYIDVDDAFKKLTSEIKIEPSYETVPIQEAYRRVLCEEVSAPTDIPLMDTSHVDGYAVRAEDIASASVNNPTLLRLKGRVGPAEVPTGSVKEGEACRVSTGGFLPPGSDAVVPQEHSVPMDDGVKVMVSVGRWGNVVKAGSDVRKGEVVFRKGHIVRAQDAGLLMALGISKVRVFQRPVVAIVSIGSELINRMEDMRIGKRINSHQMIISKLVEESGGLPLDLGVVPDDAKMIMERIKGGLTRASITLTIGGSSVGEADLVADAVNKLGSPGILVHGIRIHPGRVSGFGVVSEKPVVLLPGLIQSTINGFIFLVYPLLRMLLGMAPARWARSIFARMGERVSFGRFTPFAKVTWIRLMKTGEGFEARPIYGDSSMVSVFAKADGYIITPEGESVTEEGRTVEVYLVPGLSFLDDSTFG